MRRWLVAAILAALPGTVRAETYPAKPLTLVVPFAAGGPTDVVARIAADRMSRDLGQPIVVANVAGASGTTGAQRVARSDPDGYTLVLGNMATHALSVALFPKLAYDPVADFEPIGVVASAPQVLMVKNAIPVKDLAEFAAYVKARPTSLNVGHAGVGSTSHVACLLFSAQIGASPANIAYRGTAPALNDLVAGQIDFMCDQVTTAMAQVRAGTVRAVAVMAPQRSPVIPDVPTGTEAGFPALQAVVWNGLFFPKRTPKAIVAQVNAALVKSLEDPATRQRFVDLGAEIPEPPHRTPEAFGELVKAEIERWTPIVKAAGVALE